MLDFGERLGVMVERLGHNLQVTTSDVGLARLMSRWIGLQRLTPPLKYLSTAMDPVADPDSGCAGPGRSGRAVSIPLL